jgi:hypothetical protein
MVKSPPRCADKRSVTPGKGRIGRTLAGATMLVLLCGGAGVALGAATAPEPTLQEGKETAQRIPALKQRTTAKKRGLGDHWEQAEAVYNLGKGVRVSVTGGGADTSHCTRDETVETFTTGSDGEVHPFGFVAKDDGACFIHYSASHYFLKFTGPDGRPIGRGHMFFQGPMVGVGYYASCLLDEDWEGVTCEKAGQRTLKISRAR